MSEHVLRLFAARARRERTVTWALAAAAVAAVIAGVALGGYPLSPLSVVRALVGAGDEVERFIVVDVRLPRVLLACLVGAALGLAGALFQALLGNPLASPDIVGITQGASVGAVGALLLIGLGTGGVMAAALVGAAVCAGAIYLLAWRGGIGGERFVVIGVAVAFMAQAAIGYLLTRADVRNAQAAMGWLVGSVADATWPQIAAVAVVVGVLAPVALSLGGRLRALQLGDDAAQALGVAVQPTRAALVAAAVVLVAVAVSVAGPVAFVAFMSGPIARRLVGFGSPALPAAACVGAAFTVGADLVGRHLLPGDVQVPVGVITGAVGAPYLLWLLATGR